MMEEEFNDELSENPFGLSFFSLHFQNPFFSIRILV